MPTPAWQIGRREAEAPKVSWRRLPGERRDFRPSVPCSVPDWGIPVPGWPALGTCCPDVEGASACWYGGGAGLRVGVSVLSSLQSERLSGSKSGQVRRSSRRSLKRKFERPGNFVVHKCVLSPEMVSAKLGARFQASITFANSRYRAPDRNVPPGPRFPDSAKRRMSCEGTPRALLQAFLQAFRPLTERPLMVIMGLADVAVR